MRRTIGASTYGFVATNPYALVATSLRTPSDCIAPVITRAMASDAVTVMMTASWSATAFKTLAWSVAFPSRMAASPDTPASAEACRANAVTSWPRRIPSANMSRPLPPVDPNTAIFILHHDEQGCGQPTEACAKRVAGDSKSRPLAQPMYALSPSRSRCEYGDESLQLLFSVVNGL